MKLLWYGVLAGCSAGVLAVNKEEKSSSSSLTQVITNSNIKSVNTDGGTSSSSEKSSSKTSSSENPSVTENDDDKALFKLIFTDYSSYYNAPVTVGDQEMELRLDIVQNDVWVFNGNLVLGCDEINTWWDEHSELYTVLSLPESVATVSEVTALVCADLGLYTTATVSLGPSATAEYGDFTDNESVTVAYLDSLNASGVVIVDNFTIADANNEQVQIPNMQILDIDDSNVFIGAVGLASNLYSNTGFLEGLKHLGAIDHLSYSLFFNTFAGTNESFAMVLPGVVNKKYYTGEFYYHDMPEHHGTRYYGLGADLANLLMEDMVLPVAVMDNVYVETSSGDDAASLFSDTESIPVLFDSRTTFNLVPFDVIVNLAIQTHAFYNEEVNRWIVECETIQETHASLLWVFGDATISTPIDQVLTPATVYGEDLKFSNGESACYLNFLPTSNKFATLGLSFLKSVYLSVDNEGKQVGLAQVNSNVDIEKSDYFPSTSKTNTFDTLSLFNYSSVSSIKAISPSKIPFATYNSYAFNGTITYSAYADDDSDSVTVPARFSGATISSDQVILPGLATSQTASESAEAASESDTSKDIGASNTPVYTGVLLVIPFLLMIL